jgi:hypothetical protein
MLDRPLGNGHVNFRHEADGFAAPFGPGSGSRRARAIPRAQRIHARLGLAPRGAGARGFLGVAAVGGNQSRSPGGRLAKRHVDGSLLNTM